MRTIVISPHVFEKHMDASNVRASVFFNEFTMFKSVKRAKLAGRLMRNQPDFGH